MCRLLFLTKNLILKHVFFDLPTLTYTVVQLSCISNIIKSVSKKSITLMQFINLMQVDIFIMKLYKLATV